MQEFSQALTGSGNGNDGLGGGSNDADNACRVAGLLPILVWDSQERQHKVLKMRWGLHRKTGGILSPFMPALRRSTICGH